MPESIIPEIPEDAKAKVGKGEAFVIYKRESDDHEWEVETVVKTKDQMEWYIVELNDMYDYQKYSMNRITIS